MLRQTSREQERSTTAQHEAGKSCRGDNSGALSSYYNIRDLFSYKIE
jgi:hypothetical protein